MNLIIIWLQTSSQQRISSVDDSTGSPRQIWITCLELDVSNLRSRYCRHLRPLKPMVRYLAFVPNEASIYPVSRVSHLSVAFPPTQYRLGASTQMLSLHLSLLTFIIRQ